MCYTLFYNLTKLYLHAFMSLSIQALKRGHLSNILEKPTSNAIRFPSTTLS